MYAYASPINLFATPVPNKLNRLIGSIGSTQTRALALTTFYASNQ